MQTQRGIGFELLLATQITNTLSFTTRDIAMDSKKIAVEVGKWMFWYPFVYMGKSMLWVGRGIKHYLLFTSYRKKDGSRVVRKRRNTKRR